MSRRARERANSRPWEQGEAPEPDDDQDDEQHERCPNTGDMFEQDQEQ